MSTDEPTMTELCLVSMVKLASPVSRLANRKRSNPLRFTASIREKLEWLLTEIEKIKNMLGLSVSY